MDLIETKLIPYKCINLRYNLISYIIRTTESNLASSFAALQWSENMKAVDKKSRFYARHIS